MVLFIQTLELLSCPSTANIEIVALFFQALEFWPYFYKHCNSRIVPNTGILAVLLYALALLSYRSKRWNFGTTFIHIDLFILSFKTLGFLPFFCKHWNSYLILSILSLFNQTLEFFALFLYLLEFWPHSSKYWNPGPLVVNTRILILSFSCKHSSSGPNISKHRNSGPINIAILILSFQALKF